MLQTNTKCVIAFFNTRSGKFKWWDQFPIAIKSILNEEGTDSYYFYKSRTEHSLYKENEIFINPEKANGNGSLNDEAWLKKNVWPIMNKYEQVIIHTHSYNAPFKLRTLLKKHNNAVWACTIHSCPNAISSGFEKAVRVLKRKFHLLPDWHIGVSNASSQYIKNFFGSEKVLTIHNGIELPNIPHKVIPETITIKTQKRYLFVNRLDKGKGLEIILEALPLILKNYPEFHLTIVGDGPYRELVENSLGELNSPKLFYAGYSSNVDQYYITHDVILLPYTRPQGQSLVSLEARSHGLPAIYTGMGGAAETRDASNGVLMSEASVEALLAAIEHIETNSNFSNMIDGCYHNLEYFSLQRMAEDYCTLYRKIFVDSN